MIHKLISLGFSCSASVSYSAVTIDCNGTAEGSTFECSFNDGPSQACKLLYIQ